MLRPTSALAYVPPVTFSVRLWLLTAPLTPPPLSVAPVIAVPPSYSFVSTAAATVTSFAVIDPVAAVGSVYS